MFESMLPQCVIGLTLLTGLVTVVMLECHATKAKQLKALEKQQRGGSDTPSHDNLNETQQSIQFSMLLKRYYAQ